MRVMSVGIYLRRNDNILRRWRRRAGRSISLRRKTQSRRYIYNLNYGVKTGSETSAAENAAIESDRVAIEVAIERLTASSNTIRKAQAVFAKVGTDGIFGRSDIAAITNDSVTAAGNLITKLKKAGLIEAVSGHGKGKYKFKKANG